MSAGIIGVIGVAILLVLIFLRIWVGAAMAIVGFLGLVYLDGLEIALNVLGTETYSTIADYTFTTIPLFIFMGLIVSYTGIGTDLYSTARMWVGQVRGGLAIASVFVCGIFAAICGNSTAAAVTLGQVAYPEMIKNKYDRRLAAGCIAAGGTIGILIPPSLGFILYGLLTEQSIGKLFMAGIIPGITQVLFYMITVYVVCRFKPEWGPIAPKVELSLGQKLRAAKDTWPVVILIILVLGGIYNGLFTPTEAGAIGAFGTIVLSMIAKKLTWSSFLSSVGDTIQNTAMIVLMVAGAFIFTRFLAVSGAPAAITTYIAEHNASKVMIMVGVVILYLIVGAFLDIFAGIILTLPIIYPTIIAAGFDPIWFGVIMVRLMEIGLISPPFGLNCFVFSKSVDIPLRTTFRGVGPFLAADVIHLALLIGIPSMSLYLVK